MNWEEFIVAEAAFHNHVWRFVRLKEIDDSHPLFVYAEMYKHYFCVCESKCGAMQKVWPEEMCVASGMDRWMHIYNSWMHTSTCP